MPLKAVLLDFNGVVINDEGLHKRLIEQLLVEENLRPNVEEYNEVCLGRSDRACIADLLSRRGRVVTEAYLSRLLERKSAQYQALLASMEKLPIYPGLDDLMYKIRAAQLKLAIVSGAQRREIELVLSRAKVRDHVSVIVSCDEIPPQGSKPAPDGYLRAIEGLNAAFPDLQLMATECVAIEDSFAGIEAAMRARIPVVGVAHSYPYQMIHRRADWVVDYLTEIDLDWLQQQYEPSPNLVGSSGR
jgi:HAD superfamily hydrolase (TIGR01509 family)